MKPARSSPTRRSAVGCCALALLAGTASCASINSEQVPLPAESGSESAVTTSDPAPEPATDDEAALSDEAGDVEVQTTDQLPTIEIDWATHQLELPAAVGDDVWLSHVSHSKTGLVAIGFAWDTSPPVQTVVSWTSADGDQWDRSELQLEPGVTMHQAVALDGTVYGLGQETIADGVGPLVWSMNAAGGWDSVDLSPSGTDLTGVTLLAAASTVNGVAIGAERALNEVWSTVSFDFDGFRVELHDFAGTYELIHIESGRVVSTGLSADIFGWNDEGQAIYDIGSGELLTVVPWDVWEQPNRAASPLPIPLPTDAAMQTVSIEWDGLLIIINEASNSYEVVDTASGTVVSSGALQDLFRGPAPLFVDDESDDVALSLTWAEWDRLMNEAYQQADGAVIPRAAEQLVLFSSDGKDWVEVNLANKPRTQFDSLFAVGDDFVAATVEHGALVSTRSFYTSTNGTDWEFLERRPFEEVVIAGANDNGVVGLSYRGDSSALMKSADGRSWMAALEMASQDDGNGVWLQFAAIGGARTAAIATINPAAPGDVLKVTADSRTATFGAAGSVVEITDDLSGETLLDVTTADAETNSADYATYGDGATQFWSPSGELIMTISDAEAFAAFDAQTAAYEDAVRQVMFVETDGEWFKADLPELDDGFVAQLAVDDDVIVLGAINGDGFDGEVAAPADTISILVGTSP